MVATKAEAMPNRDELKDRRELWMARLVQQFGDDEGNEMTFNGTIIQALLMMNGRELNDEIGSKGSNVVARVVAKHTRGASTSMDGVLDELFLMTLNRRPTGEERAKIRSLQQRGALIKSEARPSEPPAGKALPKKGPKRKGPRVPPSIPGVVLPTVPSDTTFYQDVFWALLNTNEFMLNH
jgi:hypothetical protein